MENKEQILKNDSHMRSEPTQNLNSTSQDIRLEKEDREMFSSRILFASYLALLAILAATVLMAVATTVIFLSLKVLSLEEANQEEKERLMYSYNI